MSGKKSILKKALSVSLAAAMLCSTAAFAETVGFVGTNIGSITASAAALNVKTVYSLQPQDKVLIALKEIVEKDVKFDRSMHYLEFDGEVVYG